ncbi:50S ribosomal protein L11 methyltransferase [Aneurinibacillus sp. Ricciae_BoGa-3]|uniref:50S ribosomal protein L11 methyltransferase n=1 Tax=Aneurinibacillus sp. Ricciae_BoGa-3 TaxID=3022697 RepID=UPI0023422095|nr:50S ribosomal protein L11 methyltransferase [Aneurinibacillus sp. Ricciae_BoGa-3]WCK54034.1 50S ribosomal protein L11 methyltransferase [Aneurinibacillus sp. Ricciae_BoGa-3]
MEWIEYHLTFPSVTDTESVMYLLEEMGYEKSWLDSPIEIVQIPDGYDYAVKDSDVTVVTYQSIQPGTNAVETAEQSLILLNAKLEPFGIKKVSWQKPLLQQGDEWKAFFQPEAVSDELALIPAWRKEEAGSFPQRYHLILEPGGAFGTGNHGTTRSCLRFIERVNLANKEVLDIGAGSGILSIYSAMRGAKSVLAIDINLSSPSEIAYNAAFNGVADKIRTHVGDGNKLAGAEQYDLILINIGGEEAIRHAATCRRLIRAGGTLIVSGIVEWAETDVRQTYERLGFVYCDRQTDDEWITLLYQVSEQLDS